MEAPALANFYDLTQDDAPVAQIPEVINLASSSDEEPIARRVKRRTGRQQVSHFAGAYQMNFTPMEASRAEFPIDVRYEFWRQKLRNKSQIM